MVSASLLARVISESTFLGYVRIAADGSVLDVNAAFAAGAGVARADILSASIDEHLVAHDAAQVRSWLSGQPAPAAGVLINFVTSRSEPYTRRCLVEWTGDDLHIICEPDLMADAFTAEQMLAMNNDLATLSREHARRGKELDLAHQQLRTTVEELERSYWHLRKVQEVIPSCMACGNIETDEHKWQSVSDYLFDNEIFLSHGYCPDCFIRIVAELER